MPSDKALKLASGLADNSELLDSLDSTAFQATLVSGTNIKTVNGSSILGSGNLTIASATLDLVPTNGSTNGVESNGVFDALATKSDTSHTHVGTYEPANANIQTHIASTSNPHSTTASQVGAYTTAQVDSALATKQATLVSGTNIKTINGNTILGSGDLVVSGSAGALNDLTDVTITTPSSGQVLKYNGSAWINDTDATGGGSSTLTIQNKTTAYTVVAGDLGTIINCTSGTFTVSLTAAATLGAGFNCWIWNTSSTPSNIITIDPSGAETIEGKVSINLQRGEGCQIVCDGTNWKTVSQKELIGYSENIEPSYNRNITTGSGAISVGSQNTASGTHSLAFGIFSTASGSETIVGHRCTASANYSLAMGENSAQGGAQAVTGAGAMALGGSYASGTDSFAVAVSNNTSSYGATGANSVAIGQLAKASGSGAKSIGSYKGIASGANAIEIGNESCTAAGVRSVAMGVFGSALEYGKFAYGFAANTSAIAQYGRLILYRATTDATPTVLSSSNVVAGATNQLILPNNSAFTFTGTVIAKQSASTNVASWKVEGVIVRGTTAGSTTLVASTVTAISNVPAWTLALSADTTNGGLAVTFTGAVATNIRCVATIETSEVIYA